MLRSLERRERRKEGEEGQWVGKRGAGALACGGREYFLPLLSVDGDGVMSVVAPLPRLLSTCTCITP